MPSGVHKTRHSSASKYMLSLLGRAQPYSSAVVRSSCKGKVAPRRAMSCFCHAQLYPHGLKSLSPGKQLTLITRSSVGVSKTTAAEPQMQEWTSRGNERGRWNIDHRDSFSVGSVIHTAVGGTNAAAGHGYVHQDCRGAGVHLRVRHTDCAASTACPAATQAQNASRLSLPTLPPTLPSHVPTTPTPRSPPPPLAPPTTLAT